MSPELTRALLLQCLDEWGIYAEEFERLPADKRAAFLEEQGFASLHDLLAHVGVWWEEARGVIADRIAGRDHPARKYDFDKFNAAALERFKGTAEPELLNWVEAERERMVALVSGLTDQQLGMRGVAGWLNGVILEHLKEHGIDAPRFLTLDTLQREWADIPARFQALPAEKQKAFLKSQGFARFRDLAAHVIAWWEDGLAAIDAIAKDPAYKPVDPDTDAFNAKAVEIFGRLDEDGLWRKYESTRQGLIEVVINLPEETYEHPDVQAWLRSDVIEHYFQHAV